MKGNGNHIFTAILIFLLSIAMGYLATSIVRSVLNRQKSIHQTYVGAGRGSSNISDKGPATVLNPSTPSSPSRPVITAVECQQSKSYGPYRIYPTVTNTNGNNLSFRLGIEGGPYQTYNGEKDKSGKWFIRQVPPSGNPYSLIAKDVETGLESEPFRVEGCRPSKRISAQELTEALNSQDVVNIVDGVKQPLPIRVIGDSGCSSLNDLVQIRQRIIGNQWEKVSVSNVIYNEYNQVIGFTLQVTLKD